MNHLFKSYLTKVTGTFVIDKTYLVLCAYISLLVLNTYYVSPIQIPQLSLDVISSRWEQNWHTELSSSLLPLDAMQCFHVRCHAR